MYVRNIYTLSAWLSRVSEIWIKLQYMYLKYYSESFVLLGCKMPRLGRMLYTKSFFIITFPLFPVCLGLHTCLPSIILLEGSYLLDVPTLDVPILLCTSENRNGLLFHCLYSLSLIQ